MSNLNQAIRDDLGQRARDVTPYAADHSMVTYANAIRSVLDLHTHSEAQHGMRFCAACGLVSRNSWCDTVSVIAGDLGVSSQDTPPRQWAVQHPSVITTAHNSEHSALYTLSKLPGGVLVTRDHPDQPWRPETDCVCVTVPDTGHYTGCPAALPSVSTDPDGRDR
ncbi:MAG: hypothetical protein K0R30_2949 [Ornithinibacter sp.]|nr:hypothetical protein [Ornithinibacter sp.]